MNVFAEANEGINLISVYLVASPSANVGGGGGCFVSESSKEAQYFLAISRGGKISVCQEDPDLSDSLQCLTGLVSGDAFELETKSLGMYKSCELISSMEVKINFVPRRQTHQHKSYQSNMQNEDVCEDFIISKFKQSLEIGCKDCSKVVVDSSRKKQISSYEKMPKEDWKELIDCWSCHNDEFGYYSSIAQKFRDTAVYVGIDYVIFGKSVNSCQHIQAESAIPVTQLEFLSNSSSCSVDPVQMMILRLIYWCRSNSTFHFSLRLEDCNILVSPPF